MKHLLFYAAKLYFDHLLTMNLTTNLTTKKKPIFPLFFCEKYRFPDFSNLILTIFLKKELSFGLKHVKLMSI